MVVVRDKRGHGGADRVVGMGAVGFQVAGCRFLVPSFRLQVVTKDVESWAVVGGNPAKVIKKWESV